MSKKFLVTGGCGFIGSHLVEFLILSGHSVIVVDDLSSGSLGNLGEFGKQLNVITSRVEDYDFQLIDHVDGVFHLAAQASVPYSIENFYASSGTNLLSSLKVIDYCSRLNIPLVYASSSAVYGNLPLGDEEGEVDLLSPYAADKLVSEIYCEMASKLYGLKSYGLRFFNVYGPRQDPSNPYSGVISIFIDRLLNSLPLTINGGHQTRDFIYVDDVVAGIWGGFQFLQRNQTSTFSNLLTGVSISIDELATLLSEITNTPVERIYRELPPGDPVASLGITDRMKSNLSLPASTSLTAGLKLTVEWMRKRHNETT